MNPKNRGMALLALIIVVMAFAKISQIGFMISDMAAFVSNFEECVAIGNPIMESSPRRCHSGGEVFVQKVVAVENSLVHAVQ